MCFGLCRISRDVSAENLELQIESRTRRDYNGMSQFGNTIIAVGVNIISVSNDKGQNWTDVLLINVTLNDVYVNSLTTAIAVGNKGAVYSTTNAKYLERFLYRVMSYF
jgi:photosystem II stability/assembly factor-like uncharacterized protein